MKKNNILRKNWEFQDIISLKKQHVSKFLIIYYRKNDNQLRVGISISKKFANAVMRNKYRRQVRSILDELEFWEKQYDIIIILRKTFLNLHHEDKVKTLKKMIERL